MTHGEFITKVEGSFTGDPDSTAVSKIIFFTNKGMLPEIKRMTLLTFVSRNTVGALWPGFD